MNVPAPIRHRDRLIGASEPVLTRYERIAFEKFLIAPRTLNKHLSTIDPTLKHRCDLLRSGIVLGTSVMRVPYPPRNVSRHRGRFATIHSSAPQQARSPQSFGMAIRRL